VTVAAPDVYELETHRLARIERERILAVREATSFLGTAFHHHQCVKGSGVDCAHLIAACYAKAGVLATAEIEFYAEQWMLHEAAELLTNRLDGFCVRVDRAALGDCAVFRLGRRAAHVALVKEWPQIIHADGTLRAVVETRIEDGEPWARRLVGFWSPAQWHRVAEVAS
jgi:cell wall-associated NlpC family hydrolase